ncbi:GGDEF domain-containing protein [Vibrio sp. FNV 38]|nr:GGDEF domain-containing protein [Vibrio sp. FNV 38]
MSSYILKYAEQSHNQLLAVSSLCFGILLPMLAIINSVVDQEYWLASVQFSVGLYCWLICFCCYKKQITPSITFSYNYVILLLGCMTNYLSPIASGAVAWMLFCPIFFYALMGRTQGCVATAVAFISNILIIITKSFPYSLDSSSVLINISLCFAAIWVLTHSYEKNRRQAEATLQNLATKDTLTGCLNRLALIHYYEELQNQHASHPMSMLILDIDHFKAINDQHGHSCGDKVLQEMGQVLSTLTNSNIYRIGGEEFCILLPRVDITQAARLAEAIRDEIYQYQFLAKTKNLNITLSVGVCACEKNELSKVLMLADVELYKAKKDGRNQVKVCLASSQIIDPTAIVQP